MPDSTVYAMCVGGSYSRISSRPNCGHRPIFRIAPTPPGAGVPSRSQVERWIMKPAHPVHPGASASTANTSPGRATERALVS